MLSQMQFALPRNVWLALIAADSFATALLVAGLALPATPLVVVAVLILLATTAVGIITSIRMKRP